MNLHLYHPRSVLQAAPWKRASRLFGISALLLAAATLAQAASPPAVSAPPIPASAPDRPLRVATRVVPPFVIGKDGRLDGFSVDLWKSIETELHGKYQFSTHESVKDTSTR